MKRSSKSKAKPKPHKTGSPFVTFEFTAIGTQWSVTIFERLEPSIAASLESDIKQRIASFDKSYSRFRSDSLITCMAHHAGHYVLPADAKPLFDLYYQLYKLTGGAFTPLIGDTLVQAGYDADYSLQPKLVTSPPDWDTVMDYAFPSLTIKQPAWLDLGAAGKGYLVDIVADIISSAGVNDFCVNAGGDILQRTKHGDATTIGLENPDDTSEIIGFASLLNQSICGSAGNRRAWGKYRHIIDPHSAISPTNIKAVWVISGSTMLADGLSTALFFTPAHTLAKQFSFEYATVYRDNSLETSAGFPAKFFTGQNEKDNQT